MIHFHSVIMNSIKSRSIHTLFNQLLEDLNMKQLETLEDKVTEYLPGLF